MLFVVITYMPILHAFNFSRNSQNLILVFRGLAMPCRKRLTAYSGISFFMGTL